jgi:hypothetical protein
MMDAIRRYDRHNEQLLLDDTLPPASRAYNIALHIAYTALRPDCGDHPGESFASPTAANLVRRALAGYAAAALVMPYDRFARAVEARRYDIEALSGLFGTSFEQVAHRLTTLGRPGQERVPFFFLRVDAAGNVQAAGRRGLSLRRAWRRLPAVERPYRSARRARSSRNGWNCPTASASSRSRGRWFRAAAGTSGPGPPAPSRSPAPPNTPRSWSMPPAPIRRV